MQVISPLIDRFKERKQNVVESIRRALDCTFNSVSHISDVLEYIVAGMEHKNPQVKNETVQFLTRCMKANSGKKAALKQDLSIIAKSLLKVFLPLYRLLMTVWIIFANRPPKVLGCSWSLYQSELFCHI